MKKAFTLIELMVAIGLLAIVLSFAGVIFNAGINTHRTALANAEIMRKLRAITDRLDADFQGLRKDGEIFVTWVAVGPGRLGDCDLDGFERLDRIMFFTDGDFQSYRPALMTDGVSRKMVRGNLARVCYMLANADPPVPGDPPVKASSLPGPKRILARTQHILTADPDLPVLFNPTSAVDARWYTWNNFYEYDKMSLEEWKTMPFVNKQNALSVITDVKVGVPPPTISDTVWGARANPAEPNSIHMLLCEGVGEFKVQGWYDAQKRWVPEVDPDSDGVLTDSDFFLPATGDNIPGVLYPNPPYGGISLNWTGYPSSPAMSEANFNSIPGLGRALKFTFTLFDSKGVIKQGRTFTHIVYLD